MLLVINLLITYKNRAHPCVYRNFAKKIAVKMKSLSFVLSLLGILIYQSVSAQNGTLEGRVYRMMDDVEEPIPFMPIILLTDAGVKNIGVTDFDGSFKSSLTPGTHRLIFRNSGMMLRTDTVTVEITANTTTKLNHKMNSNTELEVVEVVGAIAVTAGGSETSMVEETKEGDKVGTVMSANVAEKKGAGTAGDIAKKMTGLSTVGSSLYVRGLGDRYNVAYLNGLPIPSPNPDFRVTPLSVFPTDIISSIQVSKVMSAELYGDFSGGAFNVTTRSFYTKPTLKFSIGSGINTQTTFRNFLTYEGGKYDYFGFDDGTRQIPTFVIENSTPTSFKAVNNLFHNGLYNSVEGKSTGFRDNFGTQLNKALPNSNFSITGGNFIDFTKSKDRSKGFGYLALLSHDNSYNYANGSIKIVNAQSEERLNYDFDKYVQQTSTTGLLNLYVRLNPKNNISFNTIFVNNSSDETRETWGKHFDYSRDIYSRRITYLQNYMTINQLIGTHQLLPYIGDSTINRLVLDWRGSYSRTGSQEPDRRQFVAFYDDKENTDSYSFNFIDRNENHIFYSKLQENELAAKLNAVYVLKIGDVLDEHEDTVKGEVIALKVGVDYKSKSRVFDYKQYNYVLNNLATTFVNQVDIYDINQYLNSEMHDEGQFTISEVANFGSSYLAQLDVTSFYADLKLKLNRWTFIPGARYESGTQSIENRNQQSPSIYEKNTLLSNVILPSLITRFDLSKDNVFRFIASKTLTRPKFNEVAPFQYVLYFAGLKAQGNSNLINGENYNLDFRYERYGKRGEMFTLGAFYKYLDNPIEQTMLATASGQLMSFANANFANVAGAEIELLRNLSFLVRNDSLKEKSFLNDINLGFNATYMYSSVSIDSTNGGAINTNNERPLEGASPFLINFDLSYQKTIGENDDKKSYVVGLAYNVFGPRLFAVGSNGIGDQYEMPVSTLNLITKITFKDTYTFGFSAKNLLNPTINILQTDQVNLGNRINVSSFKRGIDLSLSFSYSIPYGKKTTEKLLEDNQ